MLNITIVAGNPKPQSRTLHIAETLVRRLFEPDSYSLTVIDLADYSSHIFEWPSDIMSELNATVAASDLVIVASPTYKATYTGLLKGFLDRYPAGGLNRVIAVPVMTGADLSHSMAPDVNLRPLLIELGASVPTKGLYFVTSHMDRLDDELTAWADGNARLLSNIVPVIAALSTPAPLEGVAS